VDFVGRNVNKLEIEGVELFEAVIESAQALPVRTVFYELRSTSYY